MCFPVATKLVFCLHVYVRDPVFNEAYSFMSAIWSAQKLLRLEIQWSLVTFIRWARKGMEKLCIDKQFQNPYIMEI